MIKTSSNEETDKVVLDLMNTYLLKHTIQFFNKKEEGLRPFGSGVLAFVHETHFILTASHVADYLQDEDNKLYVKVDQNGYIDVLGEIKSTNIESSNGVDLAYIKVDAQMIPYLEKRYKFVTINKFSKHNSRLDAANYCVLGFPEKNIKFENGLMKTGASFYLTSATNLNPYEYYKFSADDYFIVEMKGKGLDFLTGDKKVVDSRFYGISGGGLWYIIYNQDPVTGEHWADYRLIGIMTQFKKGKYYCLIANKIHIILEAFKVIEGFKFREKPG